MVEQEQNPLEMELAAAVELQHRVVWKSCV
jgi:hypothetical protein